MTHQQRIVHVLQGLPRNKAKPRSLPRSVLEAFARTPSEKRAAKELLDWMIASGELKPHGGRKNRTYGL